MSELSIHELETEHADLLPEREALSLVHGGFVGGFNHVSVTQVAIASAHDGTNANDAPTAIAGNLAIVAVG
ncbi:MAG: hypothetical protein ACRDOU_12995 [Streptosporangiaceae bacterium]